MIRAAVLTLAFLAGWLVRGLLQELVDARGPW